MIDPFGALRYAITHPTTYNLLTVGVPVGARRSTVVTEVTYFVLACDLACSRVISLSV
jgi:hypothetical protein